MQYLDGLNPQQKEAAKHIEGPLMILAGAGAGKTKTITHRIAHIIASGVSPESILAVTFTNKAAREMRERVEKLLGTVREVNMPLSMQADARTPLVTTFHSFGVRLLREFGPSHLGLPRRFSIWDRQDSIRAIKKALKDLDLDKVHEAKSVLGRISREKGNARRLADFSPGIQNPWEEAVAAVWERYEAALEKEKALDFDDLLLRTLSLLAEHEDVAERLRARFRYITVDEYQDTNQVQFEIVRLLAQPRNNICVVGDTDQCIYTWRQARIENLMTFPDIFPGTKTVLLEENYRSTQTILAAANDIISHNENRHEKTLFTKNDEGALITLYSAQNEQSEAAWIADMVAQEIAAGTSAREIAVLYRTNFQSRTLEQAMMHANIPHRVLGTRFFERKEVKDVLSYLRAALNPESAVDIARIVAAPPRGIGKATLARMLEHEEHLLTPAARAKAVGFRKLLRDIAVHAHKEKPSDVVRYIVKASGLEEVFMHGGEDGLERLENVRELVTLAVKYDALPLGEGIEQLIEDAALLGEQDELDRKEKGTADKVSLMTVHASKGLEFETVFITGLEHGLFPSERHDAEADPEEERRLFYVALTRAKKKVYLSHALMRTVYGERTLTVPSVFLEDISTSYLESEAQDEVAYRGHDRGVDLIDW